MYPTQKQCHPLKIVCTFLCKASLATILLSMRSTDIGQDLLPHITMAHANYVNTLNTGISLVFSCTSQK